MSDEETNEKKMKIPRPPNRRAEKPKKKEGRKHLETN